MTYWIWKDRNLEVARLVDKDMGLPDFKALKERVGIDDVAYSLGYRVNRLAGMGRYIEMCLCDAHNSHVDTIVIREPKDKANQSYFRHSGQGGGDVISFITENIHSFHETGRNQWEIVGKVLSRMANEPIPEYGDSAYLDKMGYTGRQSFSLERYDVQPIAEHMVAGMTFLTPRGITKETLEAFSPFIVRIRDLKMESYRNYNIGFPYREPGKDDVVGYEIRGFNKFKSKATGTNSTTAAWIVDMSPYGNPRGVENVYFAESAYDIMAFYQVNRLKLDKDNSVFVSIGGTFSDLQVAGIMRYYTNANAVDCFDNDLAGRVYGIRMAGIVSGMHLNVVKTDEAVRIKAGGKEILLDPEKTTVKELDRHVNFCNRIQQWKPPEEFKDWNDVVMRRPYIQKAESNKFQRDAALAERRKGIKIQ